METVWSTQQSFDKLVNTSIEDKLVALDELGYDGDMINDLDKSEYDQIFADAGNLRQNDLENFEYNIAPFIASQVRNGLVLSDKFDLINPQDLIVNVGNAEIATDLDAGGTLYFKEEGWKEFPILGFDEDDEMFINQLDRLGILESLHNLYPEKEDIEFDDIYYYGDMIPHNWALLEEVLTRPTTRELMGENMNVNEAVSTKNPKGLTKELEEIKELSDEYGIEYFTQMPFANFDNDETSIQYQYPEFYNVAYNVFKELDFNKDKESSDPMKNDEFKYLQANNPGKLESMLEDLWYSVDQSGWNTIIDTAETLVKRGGKTTQAKDIYKKYYKSVLDDDQILADREKQEAEFGESIDEKAIDPALKGQKPKKVDKFEYSMSKDTVKKVADIIYNEMEESDFDLLNDIGFDAYIDKDPEAIKQVKEIFKKYGLPMWALKVFCEAWDDQNESLKEDNNGKYYVFGMGWEGVEDDWLLNNLDKAKFVVDTYEEAKQKVDYLYDEELAPDETAYIVHNGKVINCEMRDWINDPSNESLTEAQSDIAHDHGVHLHYGWKGKHPGSGRDTLYGMSSTAAYVRAVFDNDPSLKSDLPEVVDIWTGAYPDKVYFYINNEDIKSKEDAKAIGQKIVDRFAQKGIDLRHTTSDLKLDSDRPHLLYARILNVPDEAFKNGAYSGYEVTPIRKYNRKSESLTEDANDKIYLVTIGYGDDEWDEGEEEFSSKNLDTILDLFNKRFNSEGYHTPTENNLEELANSGEYFDDEDGMYKIKIIDHYEGTNLDNPSDESLTEETGVIKHGDEDDPDRYHSAAWYIGGRNNFEVATDDLGRDGKPRYTASRWSHNYKNVQEIEDDIKNLQELVKVVNELEAKGFKNSELRESLSEDAAEEMAMHGLREEVANYIYEFYLADVDDNIAHAVHASIPQYNIDWCNEEGDNFIANGVDQMKRALARKITDALFANAPRELGEALKEDLTVYKVYIVDQGKEDTDYTKYFTDKAKADNYTVQLEKEVNGPSMRWHAPFVKSAEVNINESLNEDLSDLLSMSRNALNSLQNARDSLADAKHDISDLQLGIQDEIISNMDESLNEGFLEKVTLQLDKDGIYAYEVGSHKLENEYGYYQGDVIFEDDASQAKLKELGIKPGDKFVVGVNDDEENTVTILNKVNESLDEARIIKDLSSEELLEYLKKYLGKFSMYIEDEDGVIDPYDIAEKLIKRGILPDYDDNPSTLAKELVDAMRKDKDFSLWLKADSGLVLKKAPDGDYYLVPVNYKFDESLTEEIWHNRGAGDCQIIERSASGRNALLKRLADGALQPYVIALNMGEDSWGQGKYYTELEDARRDWKRYKFD